MFQIFITFSCRTNAESNYFLLRSVIEFTIENAREIPTRSKLTLVTCLHSSSNPLTLLLSATTCSCRPTTSWEKWVDSTLVTFLSSSPSSLKWFMVMTLGGLSMLTGSNAPCMNVFWGVNWWELSVCKGGCLMKDYSILQYSMVGLL